MKDKRFGSFARKVDQDERFSRTLVAIDPGTLLEHAHAAGAALAVMEGRSDAGVLGHSKSVWIRSMREAYGQMDRSGFSREVARLAPELLAEGVPLNDETFVDVETEILVKHFPESKLTRSDVVEVTDRAERYREDFLERVRERPFSAQAVFDSHESPGVQEAGAYLGTVNVAGALAPEPFVSKGIAVASTVTGFIAQWF